MYMLYARLCRISVLILKVAGRFAPRRFATSSFRDTDSSHHQYATMFLGCFATQLIFYGNSIYYVLIWSKR